MKLIPFKPEDFPILISWFHSEAEVVQWGGPMMHYPLDETQLQDLLDECDTTPPRRMCWMVMEHGLEIGHIELWFDWRNGNATVQRVAINPEHRGLGYSKQMMQLVMEQAFTFPEIFRLELNVYSFNTTAIKTYTRVGFKHEGTRRSSTLVGDERWDTAIMAILRDEYHPRGK